MPFCCGAGAVQLLHRAAKNVTLSCGNMTAKCILVIVFPPTYALLKMRKQATLNGNINWLEIWNFSDGRSPLKVACRVLREGSTLIQLCSSAFSYNSISIIFSPILDTCQGLPWSAGGTSPAARNYRPGGFPQD